LNIHVSHLDFQFEFNSSYYFKIKKIIYDKQAKRVLFLVLKIIYYIIYSKKMSFKSFLTVTQIMFYVHQFCLIESCENVNKIEQGTSVQLINVRRKRKEKK